MRYFANNQRNLIFWLSHAVRVPTVQYGCHEYSYEYIFAQVISRYLPEIKSVHSRRQIIFTTRFSEKDPNFDFFFSTSTVL